MNQQSMNNFLALAGLVILVAMTFVLNDETARGVLIGACASAIGFYTGASSPISSTGRK